MNHPASSFFHLLKAIEGFLQFKIAEGLSPKTIVSYRHDLQRFQSQIGDLPLDQIKTQAIAACLSWLRVEYKPKRMNGDMSPLSNKSLRNHWITLRSFFTWFSNEFDLANPMTKVAAPKFEDKPIEPYTQKEVQRLLKVCLYCREAETTFRSSYVMRRATGLRLAAGYAWDVGSN